jgi:hypothetical protein
MDTDPAVDFQLTAPLPTQSQTADAEQVNKQLSLSTVPVNKNTARFDMNKNVSFSPTIQTSFEKRKHVGENYLTKDGYKCNVHESPFDSLAIETSDGECTTSQEITASMLTKTTEKAFSITSESSRRPLTNRQNRKNNVELDTRIASGTPSLSNLVGVMADSIKVPRTHYQLKDSAIRPLVEDVQAIELATLIRKGVMQVQDAHSALSTDQVTPTMLVNRAAVGRLTKIKSRLTLYGDFDPPPAGTNRRAYATVLLPRTIRLLVSQHCDDITQLGFVDITHDHFYFDHSRGDELINFVVHVDDFRIAQRGETLIELAILIRKNVLPKAHFALSPDKSASRPSPTLCDDLDSINLHLAAAALNNVRARHDHQANSTSCFSKFIRATAINETRQSYKSPSPQKLPFQFLTLLGLHGIASPSPIDPTGYAPKFTLGPKSTSRQRATFSMAPRVTLPTRLGDDLIDWYGRSQLIVTHSSAESKLIALDALVHQVQDFRWPLVSLQLLVNGTSIINMESSSAIGMAENPIQNRRNRQIHARYFYGRDLINEGIVQLNKVDIDDNRADLLATYKDLATEAFKRLLHLCKPQD